MASKNESDNPTRNEQPVAQEGDVQPPVQQPDPTQPYMSLFPRFPAEIQQKIFLEAVNEPALHSIQADRKTDMVNRMWYLNFTAITKGLDKSGYRVVEKLKLVSPAAAEAMRVFQHIIRNKDREARLPLKLLDIPFDASDDVVHIQMNKSYLPGFFHSELQFLNGYTFNSARMTTKLGTVQKVALSYRDRDDHCSSWKASFRCPEDPLDGSEHKVHVQGWWKMCPQEVCGLLNCFPKLREFYLILEPPRTNCSKGRLEAYIKNFNTLASTSPLKRSLSRFTASGHTYIEVHPALCKQLSRDRSRFESFEMVYVAGMRALLDQLKNRYFLRDADPTLHPMERAQQAAMYSMTLAERKALVCKILVGVPDEKMVGWEGEERVAVKEFLAGV